MKCKRKKTFSFVIERITTHLKREKRSSFPFHGNLPALIDERLYFLIILNQTDSILMTAVERGIAREK
jgi:hypothetical protein